EFQKYNQTEWRFYDNLSVGNQTHKFNFWSNDTLGWSSSKERIVHTNTISISDLVFEDLAGHKFNIYANATHTGGVNQFTNCYIHCSDCSWNDKAGNLNKTNSPAKCSLLINESDIDLGNTANFNISFVDNYEIERFSNTREYSLPNYAPEISTYSITNCSAGHCFNVSANALDPDGASDISSCRIYYYNPTDPGSGWKFFSGTLTCGSNSCNCTGQISNSTEYLDNDVENEIEVYVIFTDSSGATNATEHKNNTLINHKPAVQTPSAPVYSDEHSFNVSAVINDADSDSLSCKVYLSNGECSCTKNGIVSGGICKYSKVTNGTCDCFKVEDWIDIIVEVADSWSKVNSSKVSQQIPNRPPSKPTDLTLLINDSFNDSSHVITNHPLINWTNPTDPENDVIIIESWVKEENGSYQFDNNISVNSSEFGKEGKMKLGYGISLEDGKNYTFGLKACDNWDCVFNESNIWFRLNSKPAINWVKTEPKNLTGMNSINLTANVTDNENDKIEWTNFTIYYYNLSTAVNKTKLSLNNTADYHFLNLQNISSDGNSNLTIFYEYLKEDKINDTKLQINNTTNGTHRIYVGNLLNPVELNISLNGTGFVTLSINGVSIAEINASKGYYYNSSINLVPNQINNFSYSCDEEANITKTKIRYFINNTTQIKINGNELGKLELNKTNTTFTNVSQNWLSQSTNISYLFGLVNITNSSLIYTQIFYLKNNTNGTKNGEIWKIENLSLQENITYYYKVKSFDGFESSLTSGSYIRGNAAPTIVSGPHFFDISGKHAFKTWAIGEDLDGWTELNCTVNISNSSHSYLFAGNMINISDNEINCSVEVNASFFEVGTSLDIYFIFEDIQGSNAVTPSEAHTIPNEAPNITIWINQTIPTTITDLTPTYIITDPENDSIISKNYAWYRNGNSAGITSETLIHQNTIKGENWSICMQAADQYNTISDEKCSENITIRNYPPDLTNISVTEYVKHKIKVSTIAIDYDNETDFTNCTIYYFDKNNQSNETGMLFIDYGTHLEAKCSGNITAGDWIIPNQKINLTIEVCDGNLSGGSNCTNITKENVVIPNEVPIISLTSPENSTNSTNETIKFVWNGSDLDSDKLIYNLTIYNRTKSLINEMVINDTNTTINLTEDGIYYWNVSVTDLFNGTKLNTTNSKTRKLIVDTTPPELINASCNIAHYNGTNTTNRIEKNATNRTLNATQGDNISCILEWRDNSQNFGINGLKNAILNITYEVKENEERNLNFTENRTEFYLTNLSAGHINLNLTAFDWLLNNNRINIKLLVRDIEKPNIVSISNTPEDPADLDPGRNITVSAEITDNLGIDKVLLYYRRNDSLNATDWNQTEMNLSSGTNRSGIYETILKNWTRGNWTYYIWANDTYGNEINSSSQNLTGLLQVWFDYAILVNITTVPDTAIINQTFALGTVNFENRGDFNYTCSLPQPNSTSINVMPAGSIENFSFNSSSIDLKPAETEKREINATGKKFGIATAEIPVDCSCINCTENNANYTTTIYLKPQIKIITAGPYFELDGTSKIETINAGSSVDLIIGIKNIGNESAVNLTVFFANLPSCLAIKPSEKKESFFSCKSGKNYKTYAYTISVDDDTETGLYCFNLMTTCLNCVIEQDLKQICIPVEGKSKVEKEISYIGGGGGMGGKTGTAFGLTAEQKKKLMQTEEIFEVVRKKQQNFTLTVKNIFDGPMENVKINVSGYLSQYLSLVPDYVDFIPVNGSYNFTVQIMAPKYFTRGIYYLNFTIVATINETTTKDNIIRKKFTDLKENRQVTLIILEISKHEAEMNLNRSKEILEEFNNLNFYSKDVEKLIKDGENAIENKNYIKTEEILNKILEIKEKAHLANNGIRDITQLIKEAEEKEIKVEKTKRLLNLAKVAFARGDYTTAFSRIQEAKLTYAAEVKGEFSLKYFVKTNWKKLICLALLLSIVSFFGFNILKLQRINNKLRNLKKEEKILLSLMKEVQRECFELKKLSMEEYIESMKHYEKRLSKVISDTIKYQTAKENLLKFKGRKRALREERERLLNLIKNTQKLYLEKGKLETRIYVNRLKSYARRFAEVEEKLVSLEAEHKIRKEESILRRIKRWMGKRIKKREKKIGERIKLRKQREKEDDIAGKKKIKLTENKKEIEKKKSLFKGFRK
ncbi:MAG: hypothetical protein J7J15_01505, partial [Candidatus Aenigmarchaeota archaeon]|nr:hypothetical protein [Candidatus Aenigmarchaeota archaeon]